MERVIIREERFQSAGPYVQQFYHPTPRGQGFAIRAESEVTVHWFESSEGMGRLSRWACTAATR
jgi:hypothetical protein